MSQAKPNTVVPPCRGLSAPYVAAQKHFDLSAVCGQGPTGKNTRGTWILLSLKVKSDSLEPMHCSLPGSSVHGVLQQEYWSGFL